MSDEESIRLVCDGEPISVEDSTVLQCSRWGDQAVVRIALWDSRIVSVRFSGVVGLLDVLAADVSYLRRRDVEVGLDDQFLSASIREHYGRPTGRISVFEFIDPDDRAAIRITSSDHGHPALQWDEIEDPSQVLG